MVRLGRSAVGLLLPGLALLGVAHVPAGVVDASAPAVRAVAGVATIAHHGSTRAAAAASSSVSVARPDGAVSGDLLVARVANRGDIGATMTAAGWTEAGSSHSAGLLKATVLYKFVGSADAAAYQFDVSTRGSVVVSVSAFSGVDTAQPIDGFVGRANGTSSSFTTPSLTTSAAGDVAVWFGTQLWAGAPCPESAVTPPASFREVVDGCLASPDDGLGFDVAYQALDVPGTYSGWVGSSASDATNLAQVLALRPASTSIAHRATTTAAVLDATTISLRTPAATEAGDVLVARVASRNHASEDLDAPPGWVAVRHDHSAYSVSSWVYVRVATSREPDSWAFGVRDRQTLVASLSAYSGVDQALPVDTSSGRVNASSATFSSAPVDPAGAGGQALWFGAQGADGSNCPGAIEPPAGFTSRATECVPAVGDGLATALADMPLGTGTGASASPGESGEAMTNVTQVVVLRAAGPASPVTGPGSDYVDHSVDVGALWTAKADGGHDTALPDRVLHEPSGLAASQVNPGVVYVHSESDVHGMVAVSTEDAQVVGTYDVPIPQQWDWEDIATGPCPSGSCVFAGDIGRSNGKPNPPTTFAVYRVPEPDLASGKTSGTLTGDWFRFRYPDGPHNAEALMVHPRTGAIYVVTKERSGASGVYRFPELLPAPSADTVTTLTKVATLQVPVWTGSPTNTNAATFYAQVTAGAIHPDGDRFVLRTPYQVLEYRAPAGESFEAAFQAQPTSLTVPAGEGQGEAIDFATDGSAYFTISEAPAPPFVLKRVDRR